MKGLKYTFNIICLLLFTLTGCQDFLEEEPRSLISPSNFFNSAEEVNAAFVGVYGIMNNEPIHGNIGLQRFYENGADILGPSRAFGGVDDIQDYIIDEGSYGADTWQNLYSIALNANTILTNVQNNDGLPTAKRDEFIGEALFLRAYAYYHLTNIWGAVPYYDTDLLIEEIAVLGRTDANEIRNNILGHLQTAQDLLPNARSGSELGRVTRWTAATVMVKIYLIQQRWQEARDKALEIINNSPHQLMANYEDIFTNNPDNEYNAENIWEIDFVKDINDDRWVDHFTPRIRDEPRASGDKGAIRDLLAANGDGFTGYGLAVPLPDFVNKFPMDDLRRPLNITTTYEGIELKFPYFGKLWNLDQINSPRENHGDNRIIFRLADVYLMAAEAENELSGPANAYQYINRVRERAYEPDQPLAGLSQEEFRQAIRDERKWELAGEGHRRMDLIRWGILLETVQNTEYRIYNPAANIQPYHVLMPIPITEFELNPALLESDPTNNGYR